MQDNLGESENIRVQEQKIQEGARYTLQKSPGGRDQRKVGRDKGEGRVRGTACLPSFLLHLALLTTF